MKWLWRFLALLVIIGIFTGGGAAIYHKGYTYGYTAGAWAADSDANAENLAPRGFQHPGMMPYGYHRPHFSFFGLFFALFFFFLIFGGFKRMAFHRMWHHKMGPHSKGWHQHGPWSGPPWAENEKPMDKENPTSDEADSESEA
jgi:hypothetical protein